ncbi:kinase-like protein [Tothia fuscella]|uniref:non-specific serine/threonine protein kinase n=1 Tax=Tothia fuscella TaxID=1048955 RepID=A0A9P4TV41_9PEZI|nr:kinase-like protein [Tothia fuscella]
MEDERSDSAMDAALEASPRNMSRSMSLVPYVPEQSREIVLRHDSTVVVYDQRSRQLSLRDASQASSLEYTACPTCHRPFDDPPPHHESSEQSPQNHNSTHWMDPAYFHMLQHSAAPSRNPSPPPSPRKRLVQPVDRTVSPLSSGRRDRGTGRQVCMDMEELRSPPGAEFIASGTRTPPKSSGISTHAFSQGYFNNFFVEEGELGRGGKGVVLLVRHVLDGVSLGHFACKRVPVGDDHVWLEKVLVEVQLLQNLSHQNLVSYRHVWLEDWQLSPFGPSVPCAFILQQYCNAGDLYHYVFDSARTNPTTEQLKERMRRKSRSSTTGRRPTIPDVDLGGEPRRMHFEEIFSFFKDITSGLHHLHSHGYIHRDLKPQNCLLHNTGQGLIRVLVSDFGEVQMENVARKSTGATGTISYCAPEVLQRSQNLDGGFGNFTTKSDVFSLGMIVYFMCFAGLPYRTADLEEEKEDLDELREEICRWVGFDDENRVRADLPDKLYKFLKRLLSLRPGDRPSTEEILQVMRAGSSLDELGEGRGMAGVGVGGGSVLDDLRHRISSVESPSPTPRRMVSGIGRYQRPGPSKLRPKSPQKEMGRRSPSPSEQLLNGFQKADVKARRRRKSESDGGLSSNDDILHRPTPTRRASSRTRLALPPPPSSSSLAQGTSGLQIGGDEIFTIWRVLAFLLKYYTLSRQCYPGVAEPGYIVYPLMLLAALDFLSPGGISAVRRSALLFVIHFVVVQGAVWAGVLCPLRRSVL